MKLSKLKIFLFFGVIVLLLWALYPRGMFLGYIYEGLAALDRSERHYLEYIQDKPTSKFAILRLAALYERMGHPQKALPYLEGLVAHRPRDLEVAEVTLEFLENLHDDARLYAARRQIAGNLMAMRDPPRTKITEMLGKAYDYATWKGLVDDQYAILADLVAVARNKNDYDWVMRRLNFNLKKTQAVVAALEKKLQENPNDIDVLEDLIMMKLASGQTREAQVLVEQALQRHPKNPALLQARISVDDKTRNMPQLIEDARTLLALHVLSDEEAWDMKSTLAYALQRNHQYDEALAEYREILDRDRRDPENWLMIVYLLESAKRLPELVSFLKEYLVAFPGDAEREQMLAEIYLYRLKDLSQMLLYRKMVVKYHKFNFAWDVASLLVEEKRTDEAKSWYVLSAELQPDDMGTQLTVGRELYFMEDPVAAEPYLKIVVAQEPYVAEAWAWLSEIHEQLKDKEAARVEARQVVALWGGQENLTSDQIHLLRLMKLRLAYADKNWKEVIAILEPMVAENPCQVPALPGREANTECLRSQIDWGLRRDLGDAYAQVMQWWKAIPELEKVKDATGDKFKVAGMLRELHHDYDNRLTPTFNFTKYGSESFFITGLEWKEHFTPDWETNATVKVGHFNSGFTETGGVLFTSHHLRPWHVTFGISGASSTVRTTVTPTLALEFKPDHVSSLKLTGTYRELRQDFPQAVAFGTLMDTAKLEGQTVLWERLVVGAKFTGERDYLPAGATAKGFSLEPAAAVVIFKKPYATLGWQMDYTRFNSNGNFLNFVPIIPYMNAQYVTGLISGRPHPALLLEGSFYNGHDFDRGLSILGGDLWGFRGSFDWAMLSWLDFLGSYEFGRQRLLDIPGYSNVVTVGLSGHW